MTYTAARAVDASGKLVCLRLDSSLLLADAGPFTAMAAGKDVVCALRSDGTSTCYEHDADWGAPLGAGPFVEVALEPDW